MLLPISALPTKVLKLLDRCYDVPKFYVEMTDSVEIFNGIAIYSCNYGIVMNNDDIDGRSVKFRYSEILSFYEHIRNTFESVHTFQSFPPKRLFFNTSKKVINERIEGFRIFLEDLNRIPGISRDECFKKFFDL